MKLELVQGSQILFYRGWYYDKHDQYLSISFYTILITKAYVQIESIILHTSTDN